MPQQNIDLRFARPSEGRAGDAQFGHALVAGGGQLLSHVRFVSLSLIHISTGRRAGWWLFQTVVIVAGLLLTVVVSPGMGFIALLMPLIPVILAAMSLAGAAIDRPWSYAIGNALFFGWLLVAVFPLA